MHITFVTFGIMWIKSGSITFVTLGIFWRNGKNWPARYVACSNVIVLTLC